MKRAIVINFNIVLLTIFIFFVSSCTTQNNNTEQGNVGAVCQTNNECITPLEYLSQSNCSYTSLCIKNKCKVVCPRVFLSDEDPNHPLDDTPYISPQVQCVTNTACAQSCSQREEYDTTKGACVNGDCYCIKAE